MIHILDQDTVNHIAAGEVVERPAAVVKELVENALDAGATAITVEIKEGGISFIRITDNGDGIAKDEIATAFLRHATSKIKSREDLLTVCSLGFRGEALSSIAAVAQVELVTRQADEITGARYEIEGGAEKTMQEIGCPEGTTFIVRNLFYNTPARRKFLKTKTTEGGYVKELVLRYSLAHPGVRFHYIADGQSCLQTSGDGKLKTNIYYCYGPDITKCMIPVSAEEKGMTLSGFVGKPELSRGNRGFINYFVNGRYIKSKIISNAIEHAYKGYLMHHRYPFTVLMLTIDSGSIDVNVHPAKMEIRFSNQEDVYGLFQNAVADALKSISLIPEVGLETRADARKKQADPKAGRGNAGLFAGEAAEPFETKRAQEEKEREAAVSPVTAEQSNVPKLTKGDFYNSPPQQVFERSAYHETGNAGQMYLDADSPHAPKKNFRLIGQVFGTYWLIEYGEELLIVDQHAAHEKVLYERLMRHLGEKEGLTQNLVAPIVITLSEREMEALEAHRGVFHSIGFTFESFGERDYLVTGVPADFLDLASKELFMDILDGLPEGGGGRPDLVLDHCAAIACKAAVKGNQHISFAEAGELVEQMLAAENPYHCPHGRPTTIAMGKHEFEKKFKRIV